MQDPQRILKLTWRTIAVLVAIGWSLLGLLLMVVPGMLSPLFILIGLLVLLPGICLASAVVHTWRRLRGPPAPKELRFVCSQCGYGIVDPSVHQCPECGRAAIVDRHAPLPTAVGWWWLGAVAAIGITGGLAAWLGYRHVMAPEPLPVAVIMTGLLVIPLTMILVGPWVVLQMAMLGRVGGWRTLVGLVALVLSISLSSWPHRLAWPLHRPGFERLHARTVAGEAVPLPHAIGLHRVRSIERDAAGRLAYRVATASTRSYVRLPDGASRPAGFGPWSSVRLGGGWWHHEPE